ncbi:MAG: relaxase/mobilization nuclease domain-containing protein [Candidatus Thiodiazotropha lotti]|nr:relaxase/mobilization nuclease domain-containing protein [Candidatus Thiodiazotropha lotti]MCW4182240.1 relaxase/mobilization nuclease domain-containing protein [Candidatus Thiodiazotropha weberae]
MGLVAFGRGTGRTPNHPVISMIVKLSLLSNSNYLGNHLESAENEHVFDTGSRYTLANDLWGVLTEFDALRKGSQAAKHLIHISVSPSPGEKMDEKKWARAWELVEKVHSISEQPYIGKGHDKKGRYHEHRVYSRINLDTGKAINMSWPRIKNERISRQVEAEFGHEIIQGKHNRSVARQLRKEGLDDLASKLEQLGQQQPQVAEYHHNEYQQEKRGITLSQIRSDLAEAWTSSDSPGAFEQALAERGYALAQGDKVPVAVDCTGKEYPLLRAINAGRKINGHQPIRKTELAGKLPEGLPSFETIKEAQIKQQQQQTARKHIMEGAIDLKPQPEPKKKKVLDSIEEAEATNEKKKKDKYQILESYYQRSIHDTRRLRFWRVEEQSDGTLRLENATGNLVDYGDRINVECQIGKEKFSAVGAVELAKLKGWKSLKVTGSENFKSATYEEAAKRGLRVELETERDRELFDKAQDRVRKEQKHQIEPVGDRPKPQGPRLG